MIISSSSGKKTLINYRKTLQLLTKRKFQPFFTELGNLRLKAASHLLDERSKKSQSSKAELWAHLTSPLKILIECEHSYYTMNYLQHKKKQIEDIRYKYLQMSNMLDSIEEDTKFIWKNPKYGAQLGGILQLFTQIHALAQCRLRMIELYQSLVKMTQTIFFGDYVNVMDELLHEYQYILRHPWLSKINQNTMNEIRIMKELFRVQMFLSKYLFKDTMVTLTFCRHSLNSWRKEFEIRADQCNAGQKHTIFPRFLQWASVLIETLVAKVSFYFYEILNIHSLQVDDCFNSQITNLEVNYYTEIQKYVKRNRASSFNIILDCTEHNSSSVHGYTFCMPNHQKLPLQGIQSWPAIIRIPQHPGEDTQKHWPNIISILTDPDVTLQWGKTYQFNEEFVIESRKKSIMKEKYEERNEMLDELKNGSASPKVSGITPTTPPSLYRRYFSGNINTPPPYSSDWSSNTSSPGNLSGIGSSRLSLTSNEEYVEEKKSKCSISDGVLIDAFLSNTKLNIRNVTYLINRIELRMYLVVIFLHKARIFMRKDTKIKELTEISSRLRLQQLYMGLKSKVKGKTGLKKK